MIDLLKTNGRFYKANLHCHTTLSDGKMTPAQAKEHYRKNGYSIVAFTDHSKYAWYPELLSEDFLPIAGFEAAFTCLDPVVQPLKFKLCHINFLASDPEQTVVLPETHAYDIGVINRYISDMKKLGWLCTLNHPGWSLQTGEEINALHGLDGFEVYNHGSQVLDNNGESQSYWARYLNNGSHAFAVATDDNHCGYDDAGKLEAEDDTLGGYISISMPALTYGDFIDAFREGRFYASTGAEIKELYIDEEKDELVLSCSPVKQVIVKGIHTVPAARLNGYGDDFTHVRIPLQLIREKEPFFRVELRTQAGKTAYSQPYYFKDV
ncbi:MAG: PHP domain-containing protein [Clostridia bacterium]|nr:PHP domain-containing protein [Clostridia bacterium]